MTNSAIYEGWVSHRRLGAMDHAFRYRVAMPLFDLDELPELLDTVPFWSARGPAPVRISYDDHLGGGTPSLAERARDVVGQRTGRRPAGPVWLLANPRYLGVQFNPVSFMFCHGEHGQSVDAVIAEVTSTPWRERTAYVIDCAESRAGIYRGSFAKAMHVSPFQPMDQRYEISVSEPGESLRVAIQNIEGDKPVFAATMALERRELSRRGLLGMLVRYPPATVTTLGRIYANALRLKAKGARWYPHPGDRLAGQPGSSDP